MQNIIDIVLTDPNINSRFCVLKEYFDNLQLEELAQQDIDSFPELVDIKHKILMKVFVTRYLAPYLEQNLLFLVQENSNFRKIQLDVDGKLDTRGCLKSRMMPYSSRLCISELKNTIIKSTILNSIQSINIIDLSGNDLLSTDMQYVYDLLIWLQPYLKNTILSLDGNKIHGIGKYSDIVDNNIAKFVEMPNISYIDMRGNPFCSIDRKDYFMSLNIDDVVIKKLIWIEKYNLGTYGWRSLLKSEEMCQATIQTHMDYFKHPRF
jgi:hypothetical protein